MAIIDPEGLFSGERLASCSDLAQLYWPRFFLASNSCARIELSYKSLISRVFGNFQSPPKSEALWKIFREYDDNYLAILYQSESGTWWCQFITSEKYLPKYKKTRDSMSPAPPIELIDLHRIGYLEWKKSKSFQNQSFQKFSSDGESFGREGIGIGVGIGIGEGIGETQNTSSKLKKEKPAPDPRHTPFKKLLAEYWKYKNPANPEMPWDKPEAGQLGNLLKASPNLTEEQFRSLLRNRAKSEVAHGDRVHTWLANITKFSEPLNQYGKPKNGNGGNYAAVPTGKTDHDMAICEELIAEDKYRDRTVQDGRLQAGEAEQDGRATLLFDPRASGHASLPSGDGDFSGKRAAGGGDGVPLTW